MLCMTLSMHSINTILVPTDFSRVAERALHYAFELAAASGAGVHILHVFENPLAVGSFMDLYSPPAPDVIEQIERQVLARIQASLTPEQRENPAVVVATRMGSTSDEILDYVRRHGAIDLIVFGATGRGAVARLVMGSVADRIVRTAPCPVLTVHPHDRVHADADHQAA